MVKKFKVRDQKGATVMEASIILPVFLLFTFGIILLTIQLFSVYSTYYACLQSLKSSSTGPSRKSNGDVKDPVEKRLSVVLKSKLEEFKTGVKLSDVVVRNEQGCFKFITPTPLSEPFVLPLTDSNIGCTGVISPPAKISPNSWITLEVPVLAVKMKIKGVPIPVVRVKSTVKMYDWVIKKT